MLYNSFKRYFYLALLGIVRSLLIKKSFPVTLNFPPKPWIMPLDVYLQMTKPDIVWLPNGKQ